MRLRSVLLLLLLGFAVGAMVFFLVKGGLGVLPKSRGDLDTPRVSLLEEAALAERRIAARFPEASTKRKRKRGKPKQLNLRLVDTDLRDLAMAGLLRYPEGRRVLELAQQIRAEIDDGEVGFELVLNLSEIQRDRLSEKERDTIEQIEKLLPLLGKSDLPIGFYGSPEASRGRIRLGGSPWIRLSVLKLSLGTVSERLGIPEEDLENSLEIDWPGFEVLDVTVKDGAVELLVMRSA